mgnify:CR=1 FL=1
MITFQEKLIAAATTNRSLVCVGLDIDISRIPCSDPLEFCRQIIDATSEFVCSYKPNLAFFEMMGTEGWGLLEQVIKMIPPEIPVIGDGKRGDIGSTASAYANALFEKLNFDAVTINPYMGQDSVEQFIAYEEKGIFILCKTSNQGSEDFQDLIISTGKPLYMAVAEKAQSWNKNNNIGLVVGATYPEELMNIRQCCPDMPILIPGVGAQGGALAEAVQFGTDKAGRDAIINSSRGILYASSGPDFAESARQAARSLRNEINSVLHKNNCDWS